METAVEVMRPGGSPVGPDAAASCPSTSPAWWIRACQWVGEPLAEQIATLIDCWILLFRTLARLFVVPWRGREICLSTVQMGVGSVPIITVATAFAGMVITNEMAYHMDLALHSVTMIPSFTGQFILREIGIVIPALLLVAKVGAATTAEVGSMKVTEQIDALRLLGIDPVSYLVFPRFVASIVSTACMTMIAIAVTMSCALLIAVSRYHFSFGEYLNLLRPFVEGKDLACALTKAVVFGSIIPIVSCGYGFRCKGGAEGVGTATTNSVVTSTVAVIVWDFILTFLFSEVG